MGMLIQRREVAYRAYYEMNEGRFDDFVLVLVADGEDTAKESTLYLERRLKSPVPAIGLVVGYLDSDNNFIAMVASIVLCKRSSVV